MAFDATIRDRAPTDLGWKTKETTLRATHFTEYSRPTSWSTCLGRIGLVAAKSIATLIASPAIIVARALAGSSDTCNRFAQWHDKNGIKSTLAQGINEEVALVPKSEAECRHIAAEQRRESRFSTYDIEYDIQSKQFSKSPDGKYLIRVIPKASGFIFVPLDADGLPQVAEARQVTLFNADDHTSFADKDTILLHAVDYLNYWDHLSDKGMSTDKLFIMNLTDGTAHGYKKMPGHDIELDNVADANTNYGSILAKDVQKAIQNRHATEQGQAKKREIPKLDVYEPDPLAGLKKRAGHFGSHPPSPRGPGGTYAAMPSMGGAAAAAGGAGTYADLRPVMGAAAAAARSSGGRAGAAPRARVSLASDSEGDDEEGPFVTPGTSSSAAAAVPGMSDRAGDHKDAHSDDD